EYAAGRITLRVRSRHRTAPCPLCGRHSQRIHSRYERRLSDLPSDGCQVTVFLAVRKFRCLNPACSQRLFSERFPNFALPHRRATARLETLWTRLGLYLGGEGGARLARDVCAPTTADTILRPTFRTL